MSDPLLVAGTDGVGTKLRVAVEANRHDTIGIDLVAMCINDIVTTGARPLFFLDYFGTGRLEPNVAAAVIEGIAAGCEACGVALVGGETAELPGLYAEGDYDLAGFAVGLVDRPRLVDGSQVAPGDAVVGVLSRGLHSNGYSLARKVLLEQGALRLGDGFLGGPQTVTDVLLEPTAIYAGLVAEWMQAGVPKAMAHITGGGLPGNVPRVLPSGTEAAVDRRSWTVPPVFVEIARSGRVSADEMFRTFNMGIGFVVIVPPDRVDQAIQLAQRAGEVACRIGDIRAANASAAARLIWSDDD